MQVYIVSIKFRKYLVIISLNTFSVHLPAPQLYHFLQGHISGYLKLFCSLLMLFFKNSCSSVSFCIVFIAVSSSS